MASRLELQSKLEEILESTHVYYQPPESLKLEYPAIVYSKENISSKFADDIKYDKHKSYQLIVISKKPDDSVIDRLLDLQYCRFDRHYKADNLNHDVFTLYF